MSKFSQPHYNITLSIIYLVNLHVTKPSNIEHNWLLAFIGTTLPEIQTSFHDSNNKLVAHMAITTCFPCRKLIVKSSSSEILYYFLGQVVCCSDVTLDSGLLVIQLIEQSNDQVYNDLSYGTTGFSIFVEEIHLNEGDSNGR